MIDPFTDICERLDMLDAYAELLDEWAVAVAECRQEFNVALRQEEMRLRSLKYPATITPDMARGDKHVAELGRNAKEAEGRFLAVQEKINIGKLRVKMLNAQLEREYRS